MGTKNLDFLKKFLEIEDIISEKSQNKRVPGQLIDKHPKEIGDHKRFGHWEIDTLISNRIRTDAVLLTLVELNTHLEVIMKMNGKNQ